MKRLILIMVLTACGQDDSTNPAAAVLDKADPDECECECPEAETVTETVTVEKEVLVADNQWLDSITGYLWLIGGTGDHATALAACTDGWDSPTRDELYAAAQRGLFDKSGKDGWASELTNVIGGQNYFGTVTKNPAIAQAEALFTTFHGIYCIQKE